MTTIPPKGGDLQKVLHRRNINEWHDGTYKRIDEIQVGDNVISVSGRGQNHIQLVQVPQDNIMTWSGSLEFSNTDMSHLQV